MKDEIKRLIGNLNEVTVKGKQNMIIITDALNTLECMYSELDKKNKLEQEAQNAEL